MRTLTRKPPYYAITAGRMCSLRSTLSGKAMSCGIHAAKNTTISSSRDDYQPLAAPAKRTAHTTARPLTSDPPIHHWYP